MNHSLPHSYPPPPLAPRNRHRKREPSAPPLPLERPHGGIHGNPDVEVAEGRLWLGPKSGYVEYKLVVLMTTLTPIIISAWPAPVVKHIREQGILAEFFHGCAWACLLMEYNFVSLSNYFLFTETALYLCQILIRICNWSLSPRNSTRGYDNEKQIWYEPIHLHSNTLMIMSTSIKHELTKWALESIIHVSCGPNPALIPLSLFCLEQIEHFLFFLVCKHVIDIGSPCDMHVS